MNRIAGRSRFVLILAAVLVLGLVIFSGEYLFQAKEWVVFPGSPHVYRGSNLNCGVVTDRTGAVLLDATDGRTYSDDRTVRLAAGRSGGLYQRPCRIGIQQPDGGI